MCPKCVQMSQTDLFLQSLVFNFKIKLKFYPKEKRAIDKYLKWTRFIVTK